MLPGFERWISWVFFFFPPYQGWILFTFFRVFQGFQRRLNGITNYQMAKCSFFRLAILGLLICSIKDHFSLFNKFYLPICILIRSSFSTGWGVEKSEGELPIIDIRAFKSFSFTPLSNIHKIFPSYLITFKVFSRFAINRRVFFCFWDRVLLCQPSWSVVAQSWFTATSTSWV